MTSGKRLQLTLALIKPETAVRPHVLYAIRRLIRENGFFIVKTKRIYLNQDQAGEFYYKHKSKFFYNRLVNYMSSDLIYSHILARHDAINAWRQLLGPTKTFRAIYDAPNTIRGSFGLTDTRNCAHGSDSPESAMEEINFFFPRFDVEKWFKHYEIKFRKKSVEFDTANFVHRIKKFNVSQFKVHN